MTMCIEAPWQVISEFNLQDRAQSEWKFMATPFSMDVCQKYSHVSPLLAVGASSASPTLNTSTGDVTLYSLLANAVPFHTDNIFQHQISGQKNSPLPDFTNENLSSRYGSRYSLGYREFLKQGRPASAFSSILKNGRILFKSQSLARTAHGLALSCCSETQVSCACVAFTEILGHDSCNLRTHIATARALKNNIAPEKLEEHMVCLVEGREASSALAELEGVLGRQWSEGGTGESAHVSSLQQFHLAVRLAVCHGLPAPDSLLRHSLDTGNWLMFVLAAQIFQYPVSRVLEIISESSNKEISKHLYYALRLDSKNIKQPIDPAFLEPHADLFGILAQLGNDAEALFTAGRRLNSPILALLAASLQVEQVDRGMCEWLVASLTPADAALCPPGPWTHDSITQLLEIVIQQGYLHTLSRAFFTFQPKHPFCALTSFFADCVHECNFNESTLNLKLFMASYFNLPNEAKIDTPLMMSKSWLSLTAYRMACSTLAYCFPSEYLRRSFLKTLCEVSFFDIHKDAQRLPLLLRLSQCLADTSLQLDWRRLCLHKDLSQLSELLLMLSDEHLFDTAFRFASIANLPVDLVLVSQWSLLAVSSERKEHGFWKRCDCAFHQGNIDPEAAVCFYRKQALTSEDLQEIYILLKFALNWMLKTNAKYDEITALQTELYMTCLEEKFNLEIITEGVVVGALHCLSPELSVVPSPSAPQLTSSQKLRLDDIIHQLLVAADIRTAFQLQVLFNHTNQDCELLLACMWLAEGQTTVTQLPSRIQDCLTMENVRRHPISFSSPVPKMRSSNNLFQVDEQDILNALYTLQAHQTCSTFLFGNIISGYKISVALQCDYKDVIMDSEPLSRLLPNHDLEIATCLMNLACLTRFECTHYVCSQIINVLSSDSENGKYVLWGCDLEKEFSCILDLNNISALLLGNLLMSSDLSMSLSFQPPTYRRVVEVLIVAHSCFTRICHMEGISSALTSARSLVSRLLNCGQWMLMVRLLTGIGRYTELNFVFQILKENDQFECLLGKGLDKEPRMMAATLEFARHDAELFSLVAHHFSMLGELGALYEAEAKVALGRLHSDRGHLAPTTHNTRCLDSAITQFTDAAEHYVQAKKMKCAVWNVQQAELVAVQLNMLTNTTLGTAPCLVNLPENQVLHLIYTVLSFEEAQVVASAYNAGVDWSAALFYHCVAGGNFGYLKSWLRHHSLTSTSVQDVVTRFQNEADITAVLEDNMKQFVSFVSQLDVKYRVASQLGFKDMLQSMLSTPDMAYLKDTVWQSGFKRHAL